MSHEHWKSYMRKALICEIEPIKFSLQSGSRRSEVGNNRNLLSGAHPARWTLFVRWLCIFAKAFRADCSGSIGLATRSTWLFLGSLAYKFLSGTSIITNPCGTRSIDLQHAYTTWQNLQQPQRTLPISAHSDPCTHTGTWTRTATSHVYRQSRREYDWMTLEVPPNAYCSILRHCIYNEIELPLIMVSFWGTLKFVRQNKSYCTTHR